mgnify:CR=1 FL=1
MSLLINNILFINNLFYFFNKIIIVNLITVIFKIVIKNNSNDYQLVMEIHEKYVTKMLPSAYNEM